MASPRQDIHQAMVALQPRLRRFAYGLTGSMDEADDLVQSAYERALSRLHQWQPGTRLDSWMYRMVQTMRIDRIRADKVRGKHLEVVDPDTQMSFDGRDDIETKLTLDAVCDFVWKLPDEQRQVVLLVCVEGLAYKDAAEVLELPVGTVTSRLARARMAIKDFVNDAR